MVWPSSFSPKAAGRYPETNMSSVFSIFSRSNPVWLRRATKSYSIKDVTMSIVDFAASVASDEIASELSKDTYQLDNIDFVPGDVVLDLGGHVGMVSIYLAKKYPFIKIYSYEPSPFNYKHFLINLRANDVKNVRAFNQAVTQDGRDLNMIAYYQSNSGGVTAQLRNMKLPDRVNFKAKSLTLDQIFNQNQIERCKLLKIDIEGSEYEVLLNSGYLHKVDYLVGEFHINDYLAEKSYSIEALHEHLKKFIPEQKIRFTSQRMAE
jgi:FkbM family methyltransferase